MALKGINHSSTSSLLTGGPLQMTASPSTNALSGAYGTGLMSTKSTIGVRSSMDMTLKQQNLSLTQQQPPALSKSTMFFNTAGNGQRKTNHTSGNGLNKSSSMMFFPS